jgi:hypothetical protein
VERAIAGYLSNTEYDYDNHRLPQWEMLVGEDGRLPSNIVIMKTETLTEQMWEAGFDDFTGFENRNRNAGEGVNVDIYMDLLTTESIRMINCYYRVDFERFGYEMITRVE